MNSNFKCPNFLQMLPRDSKLQALQKLRSRITASVRFIFKRKEPAISIIHKQLPLMISSGNLSFHLLRHKAIPQEDLIHLRRLEMTSPLVPKQLKTQSVTLALS